MFRTVRAPVFVLLGLLLPLALAAGVCCGCAAGGAIRAKQNAGADAGADPNATSRRAASRPGQAQNNAQSGTANLAGQLGVGDVAGVHVESAAPWGVVLLLGVWVVVESIAHRREAGAILGLARAALDRLAALVETSARLSNDRELARIEATRK